jgi:hypothetical protein
MSFSAVNAQTGSSVWTIDSMPGGTLALIPGVTRPNPAP